MRVGSLVGERDAFLSHTRRTSCAEVVLKQREEDIGDGADGSRRQSPSNQQQAAAHTQLRSFAVQHSIPVYSHPRHRMLTALCLLASVHTPSHAALCLIVPLLQACGESHFCRFLSADPLTRRPESLSLARASFCHQLSHLRCSSDHESCT